MSNIENPDQFFEGAEKLLEIWFTGTTEGNCDGDLRRIPRQKLESMLKLVHCEVISFSSNDHIDAYVLSESSMFVTQRRFILKTCGTTTPLQCVKLLLILVQHYSGFHEVQKVFYSRKNFKRPHIQHTIYKDFKQEVAFLDSCFKSKGIGYCIDNGDDRWYLYSLHAEEIYNNNFSDEASVDEPDQTIEILMSDLDEKVMNNFRKDKFFTAAEVTKHCGIDKLIPFMEIDDYLFDPCGYSMNGILQNGSYMTIHITPEPEFSYVSFETNVPLSSYEELIRRVVKTFQPGKFIVTLLANQKSAASKTPKELKNMSKVDDEWRQLTSELCYVNNYDMTVAFYSKFPS
ncbi:S-adenosylmethionine decarboxylase proenzyme isoform X2 [Planococcus citri]|uniref:S-adenosylmethionine decarboxylase proenzyme isoform X2 n=1 Tax=Planococcus citri TaxID=170843 RepID=UPI0031F882E7